MSSILFISFHYSHSVTFIIQLLLSINSSNSSFIDCVRTSTPLLFQTFSFFNGDYTNHYSTQRSLSTESSFSSCYFKSQDQTGGAIYFHDTESSLTVTDSLFEKCNATSGLGGAIYCRNCGKVSIQRSSLIECAALEYSSGGGIFIEGASVLPEITENNFLSCTGGQDSGGIYLYQITGGTNGANLPVKECRFISCVAYGRMYQSTTNDADCGGLVFYGNDYTLGLSDSLFVRCQSELRAGALGLCINSSRFDYIIRFCFFSENTTLQGNNVLVHFVDTTEPIWDIVFLHSFTNDKDRTNSLVSTYDDTWHNTPEKDDWLPYGILLFIVVCNGDSHEHTIHPY